jgi:hypothetical protein
MSSVSRDFCSVIMARPPNNFAVQESHVSLLYSLPFWKLACTILCAFWNNEEADV